MSRVLCLKKLRQSDLTFFQTHFDSTSGSKQKSFNLDSKVFVNELFPALKANSTKFKKRVPVDLTLYGPGIKAPYNLQRKIVKSAKNWRLNGELIYDPEDDPGRFDSLRADDFAVIGFGGDDVPQTAEVILIEKNSEPKLHEHLSSVFSLHAAGKSGMVAVSLDSVGSDVLGGMLHPTHPLLQLFESNLVVEVSFGSAQAEEQLRIYGGGRKLSIEDLENARQNAVRIGRLGEELIADWLAIEKKFGRISDFEWTADENAAAPYDFRLIKPNGQGELVDVKSTSGSLGARFFISAAELKQMAESNETYRIFRVEKVESSPRLTRSKSMRSFAQVLISWCKQAPPGVEPASFAIDPSMIPMEAESIELDPI